MGQNGNEMEKLKKTPFSTGKGLVADEFLLDEGNECRSVTI